MSDYLFIQKQASKKWTILAPRRSNRPDVSQSVRPVCPFCPSSQDPSVSGQEEELDRFPEQGDSAQEWSVRVLPNKFPFTAHHELIIHSPDHHKNIDELPFSQALQVFQMYQKRYLVHQNDGTVLLFHNRGETAGESVPHPHTQLAVLPHEVVLDTPTLRDLFVMPGIQTANDHHLQSPVTTELFSIFSPQTSEWPWEVIVSPRRRKRRFGDVTGDELEELTNVVQKVLHCLSQHLHEEFSFNYYVYPLFDWYFRIIPRKKILGGFEVATGIPVITQDPAETMKLLREGLEE